MARKSSVNISYGGSSKKIDLDQSQRIDREINEVLTNKLAGVVQRDFQVDALKLRNQVHRRVSSVYNDAMHYITNQMIGIKSETSEGGYTGTTPVYIDAQAINPSGLPSIGVPGQRRFNERDFFKGLPKNPGTQGYIEWDNLKAGTIRAKMERYGQSRTQAESFFQASGDLKSYLKKHKRRIIKRLGPVKVRLIKQPRDSKGRFAAAFRKGVTMPLADLEVILLPGIAGTLPGLQSGQVADTDDGMSFEQSLGLSPSILKKLEGPSASHRPLIQPVMTYYTLFRAPAALSAALERALGRAPRGNF